MIRLPELLRPSNDLEKVLEKGLFYDDEVESRLGWQSQLVIAQSWDCHPSLRY
jgi:hypothetical protein